MSILCYTGLPGDGKSYSAVENIVIPALKAGRVVCHNLKLNIPALSAVCEVDAEKLLVQIPAGCTAAELIALPPPGAVIVIDEVWQFWRAGSKASEVPEAELRFFKEHRHKVGEDGLSTEILIIDQDPKTGIPAFLRALIELTYVHTKLSKVGAKGTFRVDVYVRSQSAQKPSKSAMIRSMMGRYKPEVWNCYISHTQSVRPGEAGLEKIVDDRGSVMKSYSVRSAIVAACLLPFLFWWAGSSFFKLGDNVKKPSDLPQSEAIAALPVVDIERSEHIHHWKVRESDRPRQIPDISPAQPVAPKQGEYSDDESQRWTLLGVVRKSDGSGVALVRTSLGNRRIPVTHCTNDSYEWNCRIAGHQVTVWTGGSWRTSFKADAMDRTQ